MAIIGEEKMSSILEKRRKKKKIIEQEKLINFMVKIFDDLEEEKNNIKKYLDEKNKKLELTMEVFSLNGYSHSYRKDQYRKLFNLSQKTIIDKMLNGIVIKENEKAEEFATWRSPNPGSGSPYVKNTNGILEIAEGIRKKKIECHETIEIFTKLEDPGFYWNGDSSILDRIINKKDWVGCFDYTFAKWDETLGTVFNGQPHASIIVIVIDFVNR